MANREVKETHALQKSTDEVKRLTKNWRSLLDMLPEMIVLVREDLVIEYLNEYAHKLLGDLRNKKCLEVLCNHGDRCQQSECPVRAAINGDLSGKELLETRIGEIDVEYSFVPFAGYSGDKLVMLMLRDITERKRHERELEAFNNNVEEILRRKIDELKESEGVRKKLVREVNLLKKKMHQAEDTDDMVGSSRKMKEVREMVYQVAESDATILVTGESGTGKELVANLIRKRSHRADKPFLKVNCNAINENLLESDLFGYEKGAFTGAVGRKKGKFEIVDGGTIFLDEIGDISPRMQASLLRVLQNGEVIRVGGNVPIKVDVRVIAATNVELAKAVQDGKFRLDLFYRLNIINIAIPPLRDRKEDIVELATHFVKHYRNAFKKNIDFLPSNILDRLLLHEWPGNVRELENVIQRAVLMARNNAVTENEIIFDESTKKQGHDDYFGEMINNIPGLSLKDIVSKFETDIITYILTETNGNVIEAASQLEIGKTALYDKMKRFNISAKTLKMN